MKASQELLDFLLEPIGLKTKVDEQVKKRSCCVAFRWIDGDQLFVDVCGEDAEKCHWVAGYLEDKSLENIAKKLMMEVKLFQVVCMDFEACGFEACGCKKTAVGRRGACVLDIENKYFGCKNLEEAMIRRDLMRDED